MADQTQHISNAEAGLPTDFKRTARSGCLAEKVFGTPELLEHILSFMASEQLLLTYSVSRQFLRVIQGSLKLQRKLGFQPDDPTVLYIPPTCLVEGLLFRSSDDFNCPKLKPSKVVVTIWRTSGTKVDNLGSRCREMLVCQPPAQEMKIYPSCCAEDPDWFSNVNYNPDVVYAKSGSHGITFGDVCDAITSCSAKHRLCPKAPAYQHDKEGNVDAGLKLVIEIDMQKHPTLQPARQRVVQRWKKLNERKKRRTQRLEAYIAEKRSASASGRPIPTFADFLASRSQDTLWEGDDADHDETEDDEPEDDEPEDDEPEDD